MTGGPFAVAAVFAVLAVVSAASWTSRLDDSLFFAAVMGVPFTAAFTLVVCKLVTRVSAALGVGESARTKGANWREVFAAAIFGISLVLFGLSLVFPAFHTDIDRQWPGAELFAVGYVGIVLLQLGWLANPCLFAAYFFAWRTQYYTAAVLGLVSLSLASSSRLMTTIPVYASHTGTISGWHAGFDLWLASCLTAFVGFALVGLRRNRIEG